MDVGQHPAVGDGDAGEQVAELLVVPDGEEQVARHDAALLVVLGGVPGELQHLGGEVLEDGGEVDRGAGADALGVAALLEEAPDAAHRELEAGLDGPRHRLLPLAAALPSGHLSSSSPTSYARCGFGGWIELVRALLL